MQVATSGNVQLSLGGAAVGTTNPLPVVPGVISATISKGSGAAAPGAGAAFVTLTANIAAGTYRITVMYAISGAAEVASAGANVRLSDASGGFTAVDLPSNNGAAAGVVFGPFVFEGLVVGGANTIKLTAVAAATASTVYAGTISAYRIA